MPPRHGRRHRRGTTPFNDSQSEDEDYYDYGDDYDEDDEDDESEEREMKCVSCKEEYGASDAGTSRECYEEAGETEEELKREIDDLKAKVNFLRFWTPQQHQDHHSHSSTLLTRASSSNFTASAPWLCFSDVVLVATGEESEDRADQSAGNKPTTAYSVPVPAHRAVLASRSPVFRAMLENEMEERLSDISYDALRAFVNYLYTDEACLDEPMACDLLVLAEKYQVKHLKSYCEKFLISKLNWENSLLNYAFAHQHNEKSLLDASLLVIMDNMDKLDKREEYKELVEKDPRLVVEIYEAYLAKQVNTAAKKDLATKS